jgi:hypothetical protein
MRSLLVASVVVASLMACASAPPQPPALPVAPPTPTVATEPEPEPPPPPPPPHAAPAPVYAGLRTITFRPRARPPRGAAMAHGATAWTVVLAAASAPMPELNTLFQQATQTLRLAASTGEVRCNPAAEGNAYPETVPQGDGAVLVEVSFRTERHARAFAAALTEAPLWVGRIRVMCAD